MKQTNLWLAACTAGLLLTAGNAPAQSLGDIARQFRKERQEQAYKNARVYTNEDIEKSAACGKAPSAAPAPGARSRPPATEAAPPAPTPPQPAASQIKTKAYWEARFQKLRDALARAQEEQQLVEDEISLLEIQQVRELDPNRAEALKAEISRKAVELQARRDAVSNAQKALDELNQEFAASGAPGEWRGENSAPP